MYWHLTRKMLKPQQKAQNMQLGCVSFLRNQGTLPRGKHYFGAGTSETPLTPPALCCRKNGCMIPWIHFMEVSIQLVGFNVARNNLRRNRFVLFLSLQVMHHTWLSDKQPPSHVSDTPDFQLFSLLAKCKWEQARTFGNDNRDILGSACFYSSGWNLRLRDKLRWPCQQIIGIHLWRRQVNNVTEMWRPGNFTDVLISGLITQRIIFSDMMWLWWDLLSVPWRDHCGKLISITTAKHARRYAILFCQHP